MQLLSSLKTNKKVNIFNINTTQNIKTKLLNLGINTGVVVKVIKNNNNIIICAVNNARIGLDKNIANLIEVQ